MEYLFAKERVWQWLNFLPEKVNTGMSKSLFVWE
jgi:hypothetical protein